MAREKPSVPALQVLRGSRLFRGLPTAALEALARGATAQRHAEGAYLWRSGEVARSFTIVHRGLVQIERRTGGGEPAVLGVFGPTESVGDAAAVELAPYPADALAATQVDVVRVRAEEVRASAERDPALARALQEALLAHTRALVAKIDVVSAGSVLARTATLLLQLYDRFGDEDEHGAAQVRVPLSRTALARLVAARTETVIRALSSLQKEGVLRATPEGFTVLDRKRLEETARDV